MNVFPAIDLYEKKAVRLYKGDYNQMTVYSHNPIEIARDFEAAGAKFIHMVDLEGARDGNTPNVAIVEQVARETGLFVEVGGGIRSLDVIARYLQAGARRVILGTAAVTDEPFLKKALALYGDAVAVGADLKGDIVAIRGWREESPYHRDDFFAKMQSLGVKTLICTDIAKDGAMQGTNLPLYRELSARFSVDIIASGGVSTLDDVKKLREMGLYGAIIGKAYYTGAINLKEAIEVAK